MRPVWLSLGVAIATLGSGCATTQNPDPWERMNRGTHAFNEGLDRFLLEPVAKGWDFIVPELAQTGVANVFENIRMPVVLFNDILQLRPRRAGEDLGRIILNSSWGLGGLFDPATRLEIPHNQADFGLTLARYRVPPGPYLVLPLFGPSTVRETTGLAVDVALYSVLVLPLYVTIPMRVVETVNLRAIYLEEFEENRRTSFDYYVFLRNAYLQNRRARARAGAAPPEHDQDIYFYEDDEE